MQKKSAAGGGATPDGGWNVECMQVRANASKRKSAVWMLSQCGGQGFDPPLLHQRNQRERAAAMRLFSFRDAFSVIAEGFEAGRSRVREQAGEHVEEVCEVERLGDEGVAAGDD